jgi:peptidoglycan/LPS O-acetylase OafA/YrhL
MDKDRRSTRVEIVEPLRGLAALSVAWFHFTNGGALLPSDSRLRDWSSRGWVGVEVFFVISGFIVPYSLFVGGYKFPKDWPTFVLKRIIRLDPPYLAAIAICILLSYVVTFAPGFAGQSPSITLPQVLAHLGYVNAFLGYDWLNPVFWTLAIEFQFYLVVAMIFPVLASSSMFVRLAVLGTMCALSVLIEPGQYMFRYCGLFALGATAFQKYVGRSSLVEFLVATAIIAVVVAKVLGILVAVTTVAAALLIALVTIRRYGPLAFVGALSYSLYLLHVPIGGRVINLGTRFAHTFGTQIAVLITALIVSLIASYMMYRFVERPAQRWSSSIRYRRESDVSVADTSATAPGR